MAAIALYAGVFEPNVERFDLWSLPVSHMDGVALMNVLKVLDLPQAVALAFPRTVVLYNADEKRFAWPKQVAHHLMGDGEKPALRFRSVPGE